MLLTVRAERALARENASKWAQPFTARLLEPGLCSYEDVGAGKALLSKETIDRCIGTFIGRPVVVRRNARGKLVHEKLSPRTMKEEGHGYVTDVFYNQADGWWYGHGVVDTDEAAQEITSAGFCSVGYDVLRSGPGGLCHDIPYDDEILDFTGLHLAIVGNPRYEAATIRLNAKNPTHTMSMFKWFKKQPAAQPSAEEIAAQAAAAKAASDAAVTGADRQNAKKDEDISSESEIEIPVDATHPEPEKITIGQLIEDHRSVQNAKKDGVPMDGEDTISYNGKTYKVNSLVEVFDKWERTGHENASETDEEKKKREEKEKAACKNAKEEEDKKARENAAKEEEEKAKKERENAKQPDHFNVLLNARDQEPPRGRPEFDTLDERLARGAAQFGSPKKA